MTDPSEALYYLYRTLKLAYQPGNQPKRLVLAVLVIYTICRLKYSASTYGLARDDGRITQVWFQHFVGITPVFCNREGATWTDNTLVP